MIAIPSTGRSDLRNATIDMLAEAGEGVSVFVPPREVAAYRASYPSAEVIALPPGLTGLPKCMQFIMDWYKEDAPIIFMDDDLVLYNRFDGTSRLPRNQPEETTMTINWLRRSAFKYGHATISPTQFNNAHQEDVGFCCAARSVLAYDPTVIRRLGVRFDRVPSKNDYDVTLQLLRAGLRNICSFTMCHKQVAGPTLRGGCTPYRTEALHEEASNALKRLHPNYVKVVVKQKPQWAFPRHDVVVSWRKAYNDSKV